MGRHDGDGGRRHGARGGAARGARRARYRLSRPSGDKRQAPKPPAHDEYRLGHGDKLRIEAYKDTRLSQNVQVRPDGKTTLPLVGDLAAGDRTPLELRDTITQQLKQYMTNPSVTV